MLFPDLERGFDAVPPWGHANIDKGHGKRLFRLGRGLYFPQSFLTLQGCLHLENGSPAVPWGSFWKRTMKNGTDHIVNRRIIINYENAAIARGGGNIHESVLSPITGSN
jgi:hypothetical protein